MTCTHDGCAELATVRYYWPGSGWRVACAAHGAVAVTEGRSKGWRITVRTWPEPEAEPEQ